MNNNTVPHLHPSKAMKGSAVAGSLTTAGTPASAARDQRTTDRAGQPVTGLQLLFPSTRGSLTELPAQGGNYGGRPPAVARARFGQALAGVRRLGRGSGARGRAPGAARCRAHRRGCAADQPAVVAGRDGAPGRRPSPTSRMRQVGASPSGGDKAVGQQRLDQRGDGPE